MPTKNAVAALMVNRYGKIVEARQTAVQTRVQLRLLQVHSSLRVNFTNLCQKSFKAKVWANIARHSDGSQSIQEQTKALLYCRTSREVNKRTKVLIIVNSILRQMEP